MSSIASNTSFIISGAGADYAYPVQLPLSVQIPPNAQSYTVTPPESIASGGGGNVRGFRHEDVGRLSDMEEDGESINHATGTQENDVKHEIIILEEDETPRVQVPMVNVRPNGKITPWDGNSNISKVHPSSLAYMKEVMKDIIVDIDSKANINELVVLVGADDGVCVHRSVITHYSKLVDDHVLAHPDCTSVFVPFLSKHILQKVVYLLYYGECYFTEDDKKSVNLVWEGMRYLRINFNEDAFFCHVVKFSAVKAEVEDVEDPTTTPAARFIDLAEVDQTNETWFEDHHSVDDDRLAFESMKLVRIPHPENPSIKCTHQTNYGAGVRIRRGVPAMAHINGDEIQAEQIRKDKEEIKRRLEENQITIVCLSDDEDNEGPTPAKKSRTQSYPASTSIVRDEEFKKLFATGNVNLTMIKAASANCKKPVPSTSSAIIEAAVLYNDPLCDPPAPFDHEEQLGDVVASANIPANNPDRTGITIMQPSATPAPEDEGVKEEDDEDVSPPSSPTKSISGMPILQLATGTESQVPKRRTAHARSLDITEGPGPTLPTLDRMMVDEDEDDDDEDNQETMEDSEFFPDEANSVVAILPDPVPAAIIPKARVNNFLSNRPIPGTSASMASRMENRGSSGQQSATSRRTKVMQPLSPDVVETTAEMRVAYAKEEELKSKCFIVASKKIPVPDDLREDAIHYYVENIDINQIDNEVINGLPESSRAILSRNETTSETQLVTESPAPPAPREKRGRGRPPKVANLNRNYPDVSMTEVGTESETNASNQPGTSTQTRPLRSRSGGRRGSRGGGGRGQ